MICRRKGLLIILGSSFLFLFLGSCKVYSPKGYSIDPNVSSFYVDQFKVTASGAPATINQTFVEAFKDKIARESRLFYTDTDPDIEFEGDIKTWNVSPIAPQPNEQTAFNRLTIYINVIYTNHKNPNDHWTKTFSHFADFGTSQDLLSVQDELINTIFTQIMEDIFNQAFNNW